MTMHHIATTFGTGSSNQVTFDNINQSFTHLQIRSFTRSTSTNTGAFTFMFMNGIYQSPFNQYSWHKFYGDGSNTYSQGYADVGRIEYAYPYAANASMSSNIFGATILDILDYTNTTKNKTIRAISGTDSNSTSGSTHLISGQWKSTNAITRLDFLDAYGNWAIGTRFDLYGITNNPIVTGVGG